MKKTNKKFRLFFFLGFLPLFFSCVNPKKAVLFNDLNQSTIKSKIEIFEPVIQKNDLLSISINSLNSEATAIFNNPNISAAQSTTSSGTSNLAQGYLVNQDGYIQFPVLGNIKAAGLTKKELKD